jgi:YesN/AraC family two-component response regulator
LSENQKLKQLENGQKSKNLIFVLVGTFIFLMLVFVSYRNFKIKKLYKKNYDALMSIDPQPKKEYTKTLLSGIEDMNDSAVSELVNQLDEWEKAKNFLEKDITLVKLAATFNSNTKYLSLVIFHFRHKKFITYINDLKIDYLIETFKNSKGLHKYKNAALAEEIGFSSTQRFATAFKARTGMPTPYFIEELTKEEANAVQ